MTVPFENDTGNIVRKLARKSLKSEKRRNLMVVIAVALASCLICFSIVMALSTRQIEKNHVEDTYEAVYTKITEEDVSSLKGLDDFSRVGEYYMLAVEPAEQGYNASYIYCDEETMYIEDGEHSVLFSTHITGDLERAADYITYISYGELFYTGSKDDFVDGFDVALPLAADDCGHRLCRSDAGIGNAGLEGEAGAAQVLQFVDFAKMEKTGLLRPV